MGGINDGDEGDGIFDCDRGVGESMRFCDMLNELLCVGVVVLIDKVADEGESCRCDRVV